MTLTTPILLIVVVRRKETSTGNCSKEPGGGVDASIGDDASDETVGKREREWHEDECYEGRNAVARLVMLVIKCVVVT
jgi:hypothetical protein